MSPTGNSTAQQSAMKDRQAANQGSITITHTATSKPKERLHIQSSGIHLIRHHHPYILTFHPFRNTFANHGQLVQQRSNRFPRRRQRLGCLGRYLTIEHTRHASPRQANPHSSEKSFCLHNNIVNRRRNMKETGADIQRRPNRVGKARDTTARSASISTPLHQLIMTDGDFVYIANV